MSFNAPKADEIFNPSPFLDAFKAAFEDEFDNSIQFQQKQHPDLGLNFILDMRLIGTSDFLYEPDAVADKGRGLHVSIGHLDAHKSSQSLLPRRGYLTELFIKPTEFAAADEIRELPLQKRKCRFPDEIPPEMKIFKVYSQSACEMEKRLKKR